nr:hypothetical protein [Stenotrophomonas maltophilia]
MSAKLSGVIENRQLGRYAKRCAARSRGGVQANGRAVGVGPHRSLGTITAPFGQANCDSQQFRHHRLARRLKQVKVGTVAREMPDSLLHSTESEDKFRLVVQSTARSRKPEPLVEGKRIASFSIHRCQGDTLQSHKPGVTQGELDRLNANVGAPETLVDHHPPHVQTILLIVIMVLVILIHQARIDEGDNSNGSTFLEDAERQGFRNECRLRKPFGVRADQVLLGFSNRKFGQLINVASIEWDELH